MDTAPHVCDVEIQEESQLVAAQPEIRKQLSAMDGQYSLDAFEFQNQTVFDDEIDAIRRRQLNAVVNQGKRDLVLNVQPGSRQFVQEAGVVRAFEDAGAESRVDPDRCANHDPAGFVGFQANRSFFVSFVSFVLIQRRCNP
jgi:hypothetical protein